MAKSKKLDSLIKALQIMPGVGPRSATRIAYHLLARRRDESLTLANIIEDAMHNIKLCKSCRDYSDEDVCPICSNAKRQNTGLLCIVETPSDVRAIDNAHAFEGLYFVLHGHLSPIDGIGPEDIGLPILQDKFEKGEIKEIIIATNPTIEGDVTASYIASMARNYDIKVSKIASGVPIGGELDNVDENTLATSLKNRLPY